MITNDRPMIAVCCIKVIWASFLSGNQSDNQDGYSGLLGGTFSVCALGWAWVIRVLVRQSRTARGFVMLLSMQFKSYGLFVSGILYLIFVGCRLTWVTGTTGSETADGRGLLCVNKRVQDKRREKTKRVMFRSLQNMYSFIQHNVILNKCWDSFLCLDILGK